MKNFLRFFPNNDLIILSQSLNTEISQHLNSLEDEFECYFQKFNGDTIVLYATILLYNLKVSYKMCFYLQKN